MTDPLTKAKLLDVFDFMSSAWPNFRPDDPAKMLDVWFTVLRDKDARGIKTAVVELVRHLRFAPSIAEVLDCYEARGIYSADAALPDATAWNWWRSQQAYVNGSGFAPIEPEVSAKVKRVCREVGYDNNWETSFRWSWNQGRSK